MAQQLLRATGAPIISDGTLGCILRLYPRNLLTCSMSHWRGNFFTRNMIVTIFFSIRLLESKVCHYGMYFEPEG